MIVGMSTNTETDAVNDEGKFDDDFSEASGDTVVQNDCPPTPRKCHARGIEYVLMGTVHRTRGVPRTPFSRRTMYGGEQQSAPSWPW